MRSSRSSVTLRRTSLFASLVMKISSGCSMHPQPGGRSIPPQLEQVVAVS